MRSLSAPLLGLLALAASSTTAATPPPPTTDITISIPASHLLPNPNALPPTTHATLTTLHARHSAPLSSSNAFVFRNVTAGSYLADIHCATFAFSPLRVDVEAAADTADETEEGKKKLVVRAWETYRGNDWGNRGQEVARGASGFLAVAAAGRVYFVDRSSFSIFSILQNPMILLGGVSMLMFFGMPKLIENMDPEMRAEFEANQAKSPMNALLGGAAGGQSGPNPMGDFDLAGMLAGSGSSSKSSSGGGGGGSGQGGNNGGNGGRKAKR